MSNITITVGTPGVLYFKGTPAQTSFGDLVIMNSGSIVTSPTIVLNEITAGLYSLIYTPLSTGIYMIYIAGAIAGYIEVVSRTMYSYLRNIEDESIGSWTWDKIGGVLNMIRVDGTPLASFNIVDTQTNSSREAI